MRSGSLRRGHGQELASNYVAKADSDTAFIKIVDSDMNKYRNLGNGPEPGLWVQSLSQSFGHAYQPNCQQIILSNTLG